MKTRDELAEEIMQRIGGPLGHGELIVLIDQYAQAREIEATQEVRTLNAYIQHICDFVGIDMARLPAWVCRKKTETDDLRRIVTTILDEVREKNHFQLCELPTWNPKAHLEVTLTVEEVATLARLAEIKRGGR